MICPYCQTNIKDSVNIIRCPSCNTPHHKECWEENKGCTTFGCEHNPLSKQKGQDVGDETVENIENFLIDKDIKEIPCPNCKKSIPENSQYCNYCGFDLINKRNPKEEFDNEFKRRYKEKASINRRRTLITSISIVMLIILVAATLIVIINKVNNYLKSENYQVKLFLDDWKDSWQKKDISRYKSFLDKDYIYVDKDGKTYNQADRIKRINYTFENYKFIKIHISDIKISRDSTSSNYINVSFDQSYVSDVVEEFGKKTLRLYKGDESDNKWKIFREYFE